MVSFVSPGSAACPCRDAHKRHSSQGEWVLGNKEVPPCLPSGRPAGPPSAAPSPAAHLGLLAVGGGGDAAQDAPDLGLCQLGGSSQQRRLAVHALCMFKRG